MPSNDSLDRIKSPNMAYYRRMYENSISWDGTQSLKNKKVIIYCEQGFGDIIQFSRYFKYIKRQNCFLYLHCPKELHKLLRKECDKFIGKNAREIPPHDFHILSMNLPFLLDKAHADDPMPYISVRKHADVEEHEKKMKIGIAWEGNPNHSNNHERSCQLEYFKQLAKQPNVSLFMLQNKIHNQHFITNCEDMPLYSIPINNFWDTATLINSMDLVISVDTSILHLAGAMAKQAIGLISFRHDVRWLFKRWYPSINLIRQSKPGDWGEVFDQVYDKLGIRREKIETQNTYSSILFTGGVGDVLALEPFIPVEQKEQIKRIYCATRSFPLIKQIFEKLDFPSLKEVVPIWTDFSEIFAFYSKVEVERYVPMLPKDWNNTIDWSILHKFEEINAGMFTYGESSVLSKQLCPLKMELPSRFVVICPASTNHPNMLERNFTDANWKMVINFIEKNQFIGVVLNTEEVPVPKHLKIVNLTNRTNILESIEILKKSKGYLGIDSCLSVVAARLFKKNLYVKSSNEHLHSWKHIYYAPRKDFQFINKVI